MNLIELKVFVANHFRDGEIISSIHHCTAYTFGGFGKYRGKYTHHRGKQVFLLDTHMPSIGCISLFFELLLPLVNAALSGEVLSPRNYHGIGNSVAKPERERLYPDSDLHKYYYLAVAVVIGKKARCLQIEASQEVLAEFV